MAPIKRIGPWNKWKNRILVFLLAVGLPLCMMPSAAAADGESKTDSAEIWVGYFGDTYVCIDTVTEEEMETLDCGEWTYSYIDNGAYTRYNLAYGVKLTSLFDYVSGIVPRDINWMYFTGTDEYSGQKGNTGFYNLISVRRYYYPYLAENWNDGHPDDDAIGIINSVKEEVPAILAFQQSLRRDSGAFDYEKYKNAMSDEKCLRIVFGQTTWNEIDTSDSVYWVYAITLTLSGSPIKVSNWETKVGSSESLENLITVDSGFEELDELIRNKGFEVTTDQPDVVRVNSDGTVTATGEGKAYLNVVYRDGDNTFTEQIAVSATPGEDGDNGPQGESMPEGGDDDDDNNNYNDGGNNDGGNNDDGNNDDGNNDDGNNDGGNNNDGNNDDGNNDDGNNDDANNDDVNNKGGNGENTGDGGNDSGSGGEGGGGDLGDSTTPGLNPDGTDNTDQGDSSAQGGGSDLGSGSGEDGNADQGSGSGAGSGTDDELGGPEGGMLSGSEDATGDSAGSAERIQQGMKAAEENVPLGETGEEVYDQIKDYMIEQMQELDELPETGEITEFTEEVREYIQELIEQMEEDAEALDTDEIIEMVREYIDELMEEAEESEANGEETLSTEEHSGEDESAKSVYLSVGNISGGNSTGGDLTSGGNMSSGNTAGGSGGIVLEVEPLPFYYYVILIVVLAALFVGGGLYRSLRFRRETAER